MRPCPPYLDVQPRRQFRLPLAVFAARVPRDHRHPGEFSEVLAEGFLVTIGGHEDDFDVVFHGIVELDEFRREDAAGRAPGWEEKEVSVSVARTREGSPGIAAVPRVRRS